MLASIPSPSPAAWRLGPLSVRAYALCVAAGILVAVVVASRRYRRSGGGRGVILDVAAWAVPFGLIGAAAARPAHRYPARFHPRARRVARGHGRGGGYRRPRRGRPRRRRGLDRLPPGWAAARPGRGSGRARADVRPGRRRPGQLVGAAVLRPALDLVVGGPDLAHAPGARVRELRHLPARLLVPVAVGCRGRPRRDLGRPPVRAAEGSGGAGPPPQAARPAGSSPPKPTPLSGERTFLLCAACYAVGSFWVESVRIGPLPQVLGVRYGALGDVTVFVLAVAGLYLTRSKPIPPARTYVKAGPKALVDDSSGDVMSM